MGENSKIEWCDATFNPWVGCQKVSPGCDHCYAEKMMDHRYGRVKWGPHGERKRTSAANWRKPLQWGKAATRAGERRRVFCASLADVFDNQVKPEWRHDLWELIGNTRELDWLLLTKRPQNIAKMLPRGTSHTMEWPWPNVWLGTTVENQTEANRRIPILLGVPAAVRFVSCEPLLGPLDLWLYLDPQHLFRRRLDWVICGGESGPGAREMDPQWARSLRDQCNGVAFFMKQMTGKKPIPPDLLVRQFPARTDKP